MVKVKRVQSRKPKPPLPEKRFCSYLRHYCTRPRLDGFLYCTSHILEDKNSPFRQCAFVHPSNQKRCPNAAPKNDKFESFCSCHARQMKLLDIPRVPKKCEPETIDRVLSCLEHYCDDRRHNPSYDPDDDPVEFSVRLENSAGASDLDALVSGSVPGQKARINETRLGHSDASESDTDYSDNDEPLKHAGVYTYEEVARIYRDKLIKLQKLYLEEMKYLHYIYCEKKRDYLRLLKIEKKTQGSVANTMPRTTKEEIEQYETLRAMKRYHRTHGQDYLLSQRSLRRRLEAAGAPVPPNLLPSNEQICTFVDDETKKCNKRALPLTKYCFDHITSDPQQVLFKKCPGAGNSCTKVIIPYNDDVRCLLHSCPETPPEQLRQESSSPVAGPSGLQGTSNLNQGIPEDFRSMDDIASLGLDVVDPGSLFGLNQFGELNDESTDSCTSYGGGDYLYNSSGYPDELLAAGPPDT